MNPEMIACMENVIRGGQSLQAAHHFCLKQEPQFPLEYTECVESLVRAGFSYEHATNACSTQDSNGNGPPVPGNGNGPPVPGNGNGPPVPGNGIKKEWLWLAIIGLVLLFLSRR